jgi:hypothetical protein
LTVHQCNKQSLFRLGSFEQPCGTGFRPVSSDQKHGLKTRATSYSRLLLPGVHRRQRSL